MVRVSNSTVTHNGIGLEQFADGESKSFILSRVNNTVEGNTSDTLGTIGTYTAR